ncbi:hypothetical protein [Rahnella laticis]|uniref:hypothetical protein n=1 Tax=Rahnella laticis TaxID=2787622 RepID=UPI0018A28EB1|nr:hypothetical protein [Rahnella laticis]MBF7995596.1 hypothetical protein [Rahnella laticis]
MDNFDEDFLEIKETLEEINDGGNAAREKRLYELHARLEKVTPELFADFLIEKGAKSHCLSCHSSRISVLQRSKVDFEKIPDPKVTSELEPMEVARLWSEATVIYLRFFKIDPDRDNVLTNLQYRTNCQNCGFISHYRVLAVLEWVESLETVSGKKK